MRLGYNTNGFAHHRLLDAVAVIAELGYQSIAITLDVHHLDPFSARHADELRDVGAACRDQGLVPVIETGARFLLDPRRKHRPTLLAGDPLERAVRIRFLTMAIEAARAIGAPVVSLWSGVPDNGDMASGTELDERLATGLRVLCARARDAGLAIGFEPEPGMYLEDMADFERVRAGVADAAFKLTLDVGHAHITEPDGADATVRAWAPEIVNVHVEGMRRTTHDHLVPWEGDLDVRAVLQTLRDVGYAGPACFELSRHSHDAVRIARRAYEYVTARG